jgi:outer membrane receptor protein involved in Fe transport
MRLAVPLLLFMTTPAAAQGLTTGALSGTVRGPDSLGIAEALVTVTSTADGERWRAATRSDGRYVFEYLSVGGPYAVEVRAIGFSPAKRSGITLSLGERHQADFALAPATVQLAELMVTAPTDQRLNAGRTGPAQTISGATATRLPLTHQDISRLVLLLPQAVLTRDSGVSIAGQSDRLNGFQIDGATNTDMGGITGLSGVGTPGASVGVRTLSPEAIRELQILIAPFDVRYGTFAGGLVNVVTRSGSNRWEGSFASSFENQSLTGKDSSGRRAMTSSTKELALNMAGPIIRDRAAFLLDAGIQRFLGPPEPSIGADTTAGADSVGIGIRRESAERFQDILRNTYGVDPGSIEKGALRDRTGNFLAKLSLWPALNQRIEISHNYAHGNVRDPGFTASNAPIGYSLSSLSAGRPSTINATRLSWATGGDRVSNELIAARLGSSEKCTPAVPYPEVEVTVSADPDPSVLAAGAFTSCAGRFASQTVWELTDNASWSVGSHHLTLGTHDELIDLDGSRRARIAAGRWLFDSLDSLEQGLARRYLRDAPGPSRPAGSVAAFGVRQLGLYAQDQWTPVAGLTVTAGLRFDVPFLPTVPARDPALRSSPLGVNTAVTPSGNLLWSPRVGFNYDVGRRGTAFVRGGVGLFSGRPIYLYFSNIFETNGSNLLRIDCIGAEDVPAFTVEPALQPTTCLASPPMILEVNFFDQAFRFPRNLRLSLGTDVALPGGVMGTVDLLYIRGVNQLDVIDVNLEPPTATAAGEGGRLLYGSFNPETGVLEPRRRDPAYNVIAEMRNSSGDRAFSATAQLQKRLGAGSELSLAYTYTDARDRMSADCFTVNCNLDFTPLDGTLNDRRLATSNFEARHKITFGATANLPLRFRLGLFYNGYSGPPYTYMVAGDANGDGLGLFAGNDPVYLPRTAADITLDDPAEWPALDSIIRGQPCLEAQRGHIMRRNSCRGQWLTVVNARVSKLLGLGGGQSVELTADLFNALNFFDRDWGVRRTVAINQDQGQPLLLSLSGYDQINGRGTYLFRPPDRRLRDDEGTRWRMRLGVRYGF